MQIICIVGGMSEAQILIDSLGRADVRKRLGLRSNSAISNHFRVDEKLPAAWWFVLREMGAEKGVEVPERLFRWKAA